MGLRKLLTKAYNHDMTKLSYWVGVGQDGHAHIFKEQEPLPEHYKKMYSKVKGPLNSREKALDVRNKLHNPYKHVANSTGDMNMAAIKTRLKSYLEKGAKSEDKKVSQSLFDHVSNIHQNMTEKGYHLQPSKPSHRHDNTHVYIHPKTGHRVLIKHSMVKKK